MKEKKGLKESLLISGIITGFVFVVSLTILYVDNAIMRGNACGCIIPIPIMMVILSSLGIFVGSFTSYYLTGKHNKEKKDFKKNIESILGFLEKEPKLIIQKIIENKGKINQSDIEKKTNLSRVKIHRIIKKLKLKNIIFIEKNGKSNIVKLSDELYSLFIN
ncbi:HTH domain-containing protein [Candidatus Woesearchaeota archaeon]|nr:HTH domain-containing protein [Candidatus Woesearchaeota archaeon]